MKHIITEAETQVIKIIDVAIENAEYAIKNIKRGEPTDASYYMETAQGLLENALELTRPLAVTELKTELTAYKSKQNTAQENKK